jgi:hypothetical protein
MRMWMLPPEIMCRKHLLGEHVECHMINGALNKQKSLEGHAVLNQLQISQLAARHEELAREMIRRGYNHDSDLLVADSSYLSRFTQLATVNKEAALNDLITRCPECKERYENFKS